MKSFLKLTGLAVASLAWPLTAQVTETTETTETTEHEDGSTTETTTETTRTFEPEVEKRVVRYFEPYKTERYGLPPTIVTNVKVDEIPVAWRGSGLRTGVVIAEKQRPYLIAPPPELVKVLPAPRSGVRYYVAGSNVVAVDKEYRIVDTVHVPSIKFTVEKE
jgi:hypothetical protein